MFQLSIRDGNLSTEQWTATLLAYLKSIYFQRLLVNPKDRRVVICENPLWPHTFKFVFQMIHLIISLRTTIFDCLCLIHLIAERA